ncbi:MAG: aminopeptidase P family protein [Fusobacteriaceae bacterium]
MTAREKLKRVRVMMEKEGVSAYYITASDYHQSEYIGDFFKVRQYISGFTGSFGNLVITMDSAALWTDGRYEVQVVEELKDSTITPYVIGKEGTPDFKKWISEKLGEGEVVGFDGRTISSKAGNEMKSFFEKKGLRIKEDLEIVDGFWNTRPSMAKTPAFLLPLGYVGMTFEEKIAAVRELMKKEDAEYNILITLDDIAWLYNIRGRDIKSTPVTMAYSIISQEKAVLYIEKSKIVGKVEEYLNKNRVEVREYNEIYEDVKSFQGEDKILIDGNKMNFAIYSKIAHLNPIETQLPTTMLKAIKNDIEIENTKKAHIKDGVALTKFIYWLKNNIGKIEINELDAARKVEELRAEQEDYIEPSFNTISAYMSNAAMPHYSATAKKYSTLKNKGLYLLDSGGQYLDGTTDVTRTIAVGEVTDELKRDYTLVLKGMISLSMVKFMAGTTGSNMDILARKALWEQGLNFNHGTGHGVGHVLGVHEGPHGIRQSYNPFPLEPGMIISNEPGLYIPGAHGIRIENELFVTEYMETVFGKFYQFQPLTFAPIDIDTIEVKLLSQEEREYLNNYHNEVFEKISPFLNEAEKNWLRKYTDKI